LQLHEWNLNVGFRNVWNYFDWDQTRSRCGVPSIARLGLAEWPPHSPEPRDHSAHRSLTEATNCEWPPSASPRLGFFFPRGWQR